MSRLLLALCCLATLDHPLKAQELVPVGIAKVDITPAYPVRLAGFGFRRAESEGITQRIWAKALVIGQDQPVVLVALDACGVSHDYVERLANVLREKYQLPREKLAVTVTHTHTAPLIEGYLTSTLFGVAIPPEHQAHIQQYSDELMQKIVQSVELAWKRRQPARLSWGVGSVTFAKNRRTAGGPVDHDLPLLAIRDPQGKLRGVWLNYACHCVTLSHNKISGDWAGFAAELLEQEYPGCTALISVGCGADSNPDSGVTGDKVEMARKQGGFVAAEVQRMLQGFLAPVTATLKSKYTPMTLRLDKSPTRERWEELAKRNDAVGYQARLQLEQLALGRQLPTSIPYSVQTWSFGNDLAMVFLPGEVVVDYALRLKQELHGQRLWINGYSNGVTCYIPSERVLKEGGYEGASAMTYYHLPGALASGLENQIVTAVKRQLEPEFKAPYDPLKLGDTRPLSPQQTAGTVKTHARFAVELMVAEPLISSPVAVAFAPNGKVWVAEMYDYPQGENGQFQPGGRVKLLERSEADKPFDHATVFLDKIPFPTGVTAWRKGVLICAAPDILYAEDTNGDGKADIVKKLYSGFGTHNYQARVNSLEYGLDGWVYGSCGLMGGTITSFSGQKLQLGNRDFRIKPDTGEIEPASGQTQQGRVRDDADNWFGCDNTTLARHYPLADHELLRQPSVKLPTSSVYLPTGQNANRLFPIRQQFQLFELSGPPGWPTAACGLGVYRDDLLGKGLQGNLLTCEPVNLVVHRLELQRKGSTFVGNRPKEEIGSEFLASTDNWFRPVQVRTGPDGCLWVVDMYRLVIEHPMWIPPADLAKLDTRAGSTMGRIYRIKPSSQSARTVPRLDQMSVEQVVAALNTANGTLRDLAMMELVWRKAVQAEPLLSKTATTSAIPQARLQALCTLDQLGCLRDEMVVAALQDGDEGVVQQAFRLARPRLAKSSQIRQAFFQRGEKLTESLRLAYVLALGDCPDAGRELSRVYSAAAGDPYVQAAVQISLRPEFSAEFIAGCLQLAKQGKLTGQQVAQFLAQLPAQVVSDLIQTLTTPHSTGIPEWQLRTLAACFSVANEHERLSQQIAKLDPAAFEKIASAAREKLRREDVSETDRLLALRLLGRPGASAEELAATGKLSLSLLTPRENPVVQQAALKTLARAFEGDLPALACQQWKSYSPTIRARIIDLFLSKTSLQKELLRAIADRQAIPISHIDASSKQRLLSSKDEEVRSMAERLFSATSTDRRSVLEQYAKQAFIKGDPAKGKLVFQRVCATCHHLGDIGHAVGPDLAALANRTSEFLLQEILDPNRNLDNRYVEYVAVTKQGKTITGLLANETANSIQLKSKDGQETTLLRSDLEELQATGKSLMPEGLEKEITPEEMGDLLSYVGRASHAYKALAGNAPAVIQPVESVWTLRASQAEIYGNDITFERPFQNIGYWHGANDHAVWTIQVPHKGHYDLYLDWACDPGASGNHYVIETEAGKLTGEVASTGGWSHFLRVRVGQLPLGEGLQRVKVRPAGPVKGALMDLRTVYLAPIEHRLNLQDTTSRRKPDYRQIARQLLDDKLSADERQGLVTQYVQHAPDVIAAMTADLPRDTKEEYRRIPWIWRMAIAAGKQNDATILTRLLDVSLPQEEESLRDWQAVVIGGGIINGVSTLDLWPNERIKSFIHNEFGLQKRWQRLLNQARTMAEDENINTGTRYDALRIVALDQPERAIPVLRKYLSKGIHEELQMGAVSGLVDVPVPESAKLLGAALEHLSGENRRLALDGLLRTPERGELLVGLLKSGKVGSQALPDATWKRLKSKAKDWPRELQEQVGQLARTAGK